MDIIHQNYGHIYTQIQKNNNRDIATSTDTYSPQVPTTHLLRDEVGFDDASQGAVDRPSTRAEPHRAATYGVYGGK